jgi:hypothetical protein
MADADEQVKQAVSAFKAGRKAEARSILESVVEQNQQHEEAWLYLSALVDSLEEQEICLENVLALNPNNPKAKRGLETVRQKIAAQKKSPPGAGSSPAPAKGASPFGAPSTPPIGAEFESASGDKPFGSAVDDQAPFGGFDAGSPPPPAEQPYDWFSGSPESLAEPETKPDDESYSIPTSVDWGRDDQPATHGSGQNVEMPSAQEWDSWVQGLNIAQDAPKEPEQPADPFDNSALPFVMDDSAPFGQTSYMVDDDDTAPLDMGQREESAADPFGSEPFGSSSVWDSSFGDEAVVEDAPPEEAAISPFVTPDTAPAVFAYEEEAAPTSDAFAFDADAVEIGEEDLVFDFDEEESGDDLGVEAAGKGKAAPQAAKSAGSAAAPKPGAEYLRLIPGEIEAKAGGIEQRSLMMLGGIVVLALLNLVSFALLLL